MRWLAFVSFLLALGPGCRREPAAVGTLSPPPPPRMRPDRAPGRVGASAPAHEVPQHVELVAQARRRSDTSEAVARNNSRSAIAFSRAASEAIALARLTGDDRDYARAEAMVDAAFETPRALPPYLLRARLHATLHRFDRAEADLAEHTARPPIGARQRIAEVLLAADLALQRGRYAQAERGYEEALALGPSRAALASMAHYRWRTGDFEEAEALYGRVLARVGPGDAEPGAWTHVQLGLMDLERGRLDEALAHYHDAEAHIRGFWLVEEHIAEVSHLLGRTAESKRMYVDLVERTENPELMDALAAILREEGDEDGAREHIARARRIYDERMQRIPEATYGHALEHHLAYGDPARALELAQRNRAIRPNAESDVLLARAYMKVGRIQDAKRSIDAALATPVRMARLHATAAAVYAAAGELAAARDHAVSAAAIDPTVVIP